MKELSMSIEKRKEDLCCLAIFLFILCSPETILVGTNSSRIPAMISRYSPFLACGALGSIYACRRKFDLLGNCMIILCISVICFWITAVFSQGAVNIMNVFYHCAAILSGAMVVGVLSIKRFVKCFEKVLYFLALYSLVCFGLANLSAEIIRKFPIIVNTAGIRFHCLGLAVFTEYSLIDSFYLRNFGMFREPGVYQMFLNFALCCYLFCKTDDKKTSLFHIAVYVITILTTTSTTGIFSLLVMMIAYIAEQNMQNKRIKRWILIGGIIVVFVILSGYSDKLFYAANKLSDKESDSVISRIGSIRVNLRIFFEHPIIGVGHSNIDRIFAQYLNASDGAAHNTNTVLFMFSCYGIVFGSLFLIGNCRLMCRMTRDSVARLFLCVFLVLMMSGENLAYSYYIYTLLMYGYIDRTIIRED